MNEITTTLRPHRADPEAVALHEALRRFVQRRLADRDAGDDIVQETYVRLYDYRRTRTVGNVGAFCFRIARNLVHDHFRARHAAPPAVELTDSIACARPRADDMLDYRQRVDLLVRALKVMPPLRREIFLRRRLDGIATATIANDLQMSVAAIEKHCTRALGDLRAALYRRGLPAGAER